MRQVAVIREAECIGCTKCIPACPADAILGSAQWMHTVIRDECIGCKLCIAPCPVDCIEMISIENNNINNDDKVSRHERAKYFKKRYQARRIRLEKNKLKQLEKNFQKTQTTLLDKKAYIQAALMRAKIKKL